MPSSRDSSLWRSLAVAFGDGLAFAVGMKLTQAAGRQLSASRPSAPGATVPPRSDRTPLADGIEQTEQNLKLIERVQRTQAAGSGAVGQKVLEAIVSALEARLAEHSGQVDRRLADLEARFAIELRSLDQQDHSIAKRISGDIGALRQQMVGLHREFGEAVARIVAEQVSSQVEARAAALEQSIAARVAVAVEAAVETRLRSARREFHESLARMVAERVSSQLQAGVAALEESLHRQIPAAVETAVGAAVPTAIESCLAAMSASLEPLEQQLRAELAHKDREIAELRQRLGDTDTSVRELILGIGQICRQAAEKVVARVEPQERGSAHGQPLSPEVTAQFADRDTGQEGAEAPRPPDEQKDGAGPESQYDHPVPGVDQAQKPNRLWRVPLVS
jgi:hypothetical protein